MFEADEHQRLVQETARRYAQDALAKVAAQLDREGRFPAEQLRELAELGMMGVNIPEEYGGAQAGAVAYALAMMEIAQGCASTAVTMAVTNMVGETIVKFGTPEQRRRYVPELTSGRFAAGSFGLSEPSGGSDAAALRTSARRDGSGWVLNGEKQWITSGDRAGVIIVWARTQAGSGSQGISAFLVEGGQKGLRLGKREDKMGLRASSTVSLAFEELRLRADQLLGEEGHARWSLSDKGLAVAREFGLISRDGVLIDRALLRKQLVDLALEFEKMYRVVSRPGPMPPQAVSLEK